MSALDSCRYEDCIQWTMNGKAFVIIDAQCAEEKLLTEMFHGTKMKSFVRMVSRSQDTFKGHIS